MRRPLLTLAVLAALAAAFGAGRLAQSQQAAPPPPGADVGFVHLRRLFERYRPYQDDLLAARARAKANEKTLNVERTRLFELENEVEVVAEGGPKQRYLQIQIASLKAKIDNLESWFQDNDGRRLREVQIRHYRRVLEAIDRYARGHNLRAVFRYDPPEWPEKDLGRLYTDAKIEFLMATNVTLYRQEAPGVDLTDALLAELNAAK